MLKEVSRRLKVYGLIVVLCQSLNGKYYNSAFRENGVY
jgi:hypothetical protein